MQRLSKKQVAICKCIAQGMSDKQIVDELGLKQDALRYHMRAMFRATRSRSRVDLVMWFFFNRVEFKKGLPKMVTTKS